MLVCDCESGSHAGDVAHEGSNLSVSPCHWAKPPVSSLLILWKHLPAFAGLYFIFPFIVPRFLYGKLGTSLSLGLTLKRPWDWQTNKHTARKITKPVGRHYDGRIVRPSHTSDHCVLFLCHESLSVNSGEADSLWKNSWTVVSASVFKQNQHSSFYLWSIYLKRDTAFTYYG